MTTDFHPLMQSFLETIILEKASDLHLGSNMCPRMFRNNRLTSAGFGAISVLCAEKVDELIRSTMTVDQYKQYVKGQEVDYSLTLDGGFSFRAMAYVKNGESIFVARRLPDHSH